MEYKDIEDKLKSDAENIEQKNFSDRWAEIRGREELTFTETETSPELVAESAATGGTSGKRSPKKPNIKFIAISAAVLIALALALAILLPLTFSKNSMKNFNGEQLSGNSGDAIDDEYHFYQAGEYESKTSDITLKEYSQQHNSEILYFDWYDETLDCQDYVFTLKDSDEIIFFNEAIYHNASDNYIEIYVIEKSIQTDFFERHDLMCSTQSYESAKGVTISWGGDSNEVLASFLYGEYKYYLSINSIVGEPDDILDYVEILLG